MRKVIVSREVTTKDATVSKGYIMKGDKGDFMLARDTEGRFIWVRLNPPKITKVFNAYDTLQEALEAKVNDYYKILEIDENDIEINFNF